MRKSPPGTHTMFLGPFTPSPSTTTGAFFAAVAGPGKIRGAKKPASEAATTSTTPTIHSRLLLAAGAAGAADTGSTGLRDGATGGLAILRLRRLMLPQNENPSLASILIRRPARTVRPPRYGDVLI